LECWEPSERLLIGTGKQRKTCVEVAGRRTFRILTSSQQSGIHSKEQQYTHSTANPHKMATIHTRQLQQLTRPTNNNYTQDNLKLTTIHTSKIIMHNTKGENTQARGYCVQFLVIFFLQSLIHSNVYPSSSLLFIFYAYKPFP
jgi:hypothetical protein